MVKKGRKRGTIRFGLLPTNGAKTVKLAGDFSDWQPIAMRKQKDGSFAVTIPLERGEHQYKFMIDDQWLLDPDNHSNAVNSFGSLNSVVMAE